jgi:hypothetical protein
MRADCKSLLENTFLRFTNITGPFPLFAVCSRAIRECADPGSTKTE